MENVNVENQNGLQKAESVSDIRPTSMFVTKELFEHVQRVASMFSKSDLVPKRYQGNVGNCVIALEMANRIGASPLMVMQNLDVILGKPSWSSKFLIGSANACGKFSPLRFEEDEKDGGRTRCWAYDKANSEKIFGAWVSMEMAKAEGWIDKNGSKWKTMPELMRRYRAASFFVNQFAPEISMGLSTTEEVYDISPAYNTNGSDKAGKESERIALLLADAKTIEEVDQLQQQMPDIDVELFQKRKSELTANIKVEEPELTDEIFIEISMAENMQHINAIVEAYPGLHTNTEFKAAINSRKIEIGKQLKKQTA